MISNRCKKCGRFKSLSIQPACPLHLDKIPVFLHHADSPRKGKQLTQESLQSAIKDFKRQAGKDRVWIDPRALQRRNTV
jgi:hypothetical protein